MSDDADPLEHLASERGQPETRVEFHAQLAELENRLIEIAEQVAAAITPVTEAFLDADRYGADEWVARDHQLTEACRRQEDACYELLARQSPVAGDLRRIVATLRCTGDVQRSGNLLGHVASSLTWVHPPQLSDELRRIIRELGSVVSTVCHNAVQAWRDTDSLAAVELQDADDQVDLLQKALLTELYTGECSVEEAVSLALIARYYERIADHGVELARAVTYAVTGQRLTDA
jgi:phosphate transport system protein